LPVESPPYHDVEVDCFHIKIPIPLAPFSCLHGGGHS
jgi:hypothetical protein